MKILHTSDWHVDLHSAQLGDAAPSARSARWRTVSRLLDLARSSEVDLVLVAGDVFDSVDVDDSSVGRLAELLNAIAPVPIVILPGNHDPVIAGGVWERKAWSQAGPHVHLALKSEPVEMTTAAGVSYVLFPCPVRQKQSRLDPTEWIPVREDNDTRLRIGLAHGSVDTVRKVENFPIARDRATVAGLDYLALGDWHGQRILNRGTGGGATAYPGTPETTSFGEQRTGNALLVHLDDERASAPRLEQVRVGECQWLAGKVDIRDATDLAELEADLLALGSAETALARLEVRLLTTDDAGGQDLAEPRGDEAGQDSHQTSLLQPNMLEVGGPANLGSERLTLVEAVETFRAKWAERLLYLDWQLSELNIGSEDLPATLASVDAVLLQAINGDVVDESLADVVDADADVLREARWQLRMLVSDAVASDDQAILSQ